MRTRAEIKRLLEVVDGDIHISDSPLWLDPRRRKDLAFISHAHADHAVKHKKVIASRTCLPLYQQRVGNVLGEGYDYGRPFKVEDLRVTLLPAGHVLGSAQILIERDGLSLLYSGDFKLRDCATAEKIEIRRADILIVESTFGLPHYRFPSRDEVILQLKGFLEQTRAAGQTPVLLAYSLGKAQETMRIVSDLGSESWVHDAIYRIAGIYEEQGVKLGPYRRFALDTWKSTARHASTPRVIVMPPYFRNLGMLRGIGPRRTALLSGYALDKNTPHGHNADQCIPLSDHADFTELIEYVRHVAPKVVLTTHGPDEFRGYLAKEGFCALPLKPSAQGVLFEDA